ncbi:hypothetical protein BpHYR1_051402 [Brachionus plicatilis]|uniref:Uncharacterized protein n=1 Tax=Brachionus plicatilis TaxID=10195 RepID=A0A3M7S2I6_BRAPC|nr:hypothetical protein BpHYR1_051402 [Brachionus plicatilis]
MKQSETYVVSLSAEVWKICFCMKFHNAILWRTLQSKESLEAKYIILSTIFTFNFCPFTYASPAIESNQKLPDSGLNLKFQQNSIVTQCVNKIIYCNTIQNCESSSFELLEQNFVYSNFPNVLLVPQTKRIFDRRTGFVKFSTKGTEQSFKIYSAKICINY